VLRNAPSGERLLTPDALERLANELTDLRQRLKSAESELAPLLEKVHPENLPSARNFIHYLALRRYDIRDLQQRLARAGLSSLGRSESHVLVTVDRILELIALARGEAIPAADGEPVGFREGERILADNAVRLLGPAPQHRLVRIMVTLPKEAATAIELVKNLLSAGMNCARINCARGDAAQWAAMIANIRAAQRELGLECRVLTDLGGPKLRTTEVIGRRKPLRLFAGNRFELVRDGACECKGKRAPPRVGCDTPQVFEDAEVGQPIWFDDGRIGGIIEEKTAEGFYVQVTHAKPKGSKLRAERGINLPETSLKIPLFSDKDRADLAAVAPLADAIEMSFVQREEQIDELHSALDDLDADQLGVVLKIEKRSAFAELPRLILAAMRRRSCGVMIARGDLAIETGFERMAELQEEILWIAEAAHVPTIWATQVLENLAKEGMLSRAEVTDAAMSARAEAVMLNKGPFIIDAIRTLDDILGRMKEHQSKKRALYPALSVSESLWAIQRTSEQAH
jgi:pyruvate kinase